MIVGSLLNRICNNYHFKRAGGVIDPVMCCIFLIANTNVNKIGLKLKKISHTLHQIGFNSRDFRYVEGNPLFHNKTSFIVNKIIFCVL